MPEVLGFMVLKAEKLSAWYGAAQVLFDVDIQVSRGEVIAIMGRNGAGKSTLFRTLMGLQEKRSGKVSFLGRDVSNTAPYAVARLGLGYVPEERRIFSDLTVDENLAMGRQPSRVWPDGREAVKWTRQQLFSLFPQLEQMRRRYGAHMSGGEQQMLTLARTLMGNPFLLLLDEPSAGLAPVVIEKLAEVILLLKKQGVCILLSEQNLQFAALVADRTYILEKGEVRFDGSLADLAHNHELRVDYLDG